MTDTGKKRVSSLAKENEVTSDVLLRLLNEAGVEAKTSSSTIDQAAFQKVKPLLAAEKDRKEREELVRSGKKIPMKAVLKKAPPAPAFVPAAKKEAPAAPKIETVSAPIVSTPAPAPAPRVEAPAAPKAAAPAPEAPAAAPAPKAEAPAARAEAPVAPAPSSNEPPAAPVAAPAAPTPETPAAGGGSSGNLRVSVEAPDAAMLARIAKSRAESASRMRGGPGSGQGYSGHFSRGPGAPGGPGGYAPRGPGGPGGPGREGGLGRTGGHLAPSRSPGGPGGAGPSRPFDGPKDAYALRAQAAGVTGTGIPGRGPGDRDRRGPGGPGAGASGGPGRGPGGPGAGGPASRGRGKRKTREQIEQELLAARNNVSKVMASLSRTPGGKARLKDRKEGGEDEGEESKRILQVSEFVTIGELAGLMNVLPAQVIAKCMELGMMVTINQRLDHEIIGLVADEFGYTAELMDEYAQEAAAEEGDEETGGELVPRAPIITVMGHVDHGKTSILDHIRKTNVIAGESGGITQHIGAYAVDTVHGPICFLDTPGHEAFSAMRARGANVTDVVLLVVAADSMVMPQTKEAIQLAKNANVQIVVAINKIDLPTANPDKIRTQLAENGVEVEQWGGKIPCVEVSARSGLNMDKLLETLALESEILELKANPERNALGAVIESRLDKGKGAVATMLVQNGTLRVGDAIVTGVFAGRVRSLLDERGKPRKEAGPSTPVQVLGLEGAPQAGDSFMVVADEREAREIANRRRIAAKDRELRQKRHITLDQLSDRIKSGEFHELKVLIKADTDGSVEAIAGSLERLSTKEVRVNVISKGVGAVRDADIQMAAASDALIIAFHVLPSEAVRDLAEQEGVTINSYRIIYEIVDEIKSAMEGLLKPEYREEVAGEAEILQIFHIPKVGVIAGCKVQSGSVERDLKARLYRGGIEVGEAKVVSLKREKDDAKSVKAGFECGIGLEGVKNIQEGDVLAFFRKVEIARKLSAALSA
ncbi:MAG: infB [Fibrobacteria bacterium]|jgi:translation initiation factor IF-2|nr:infB [Fibrobacteria bacterium]